jgi:Nuclease A inhibitor-like protein
MALSSVRSTPSSFTAKPTTALFSADVARSFKANVKSLTYTSDADYPFAFATLKDSGKGLDANSVMRQLYPVLKREIFTDSASSKNLTVAKYSPADAATFIKSIGDSQLNDASAASVAQGKKLKRAFTALRTGLDDVGVFKIGPRDAKTHKLADDQGLYAYVVAGRSKDGKIAAAYFGSVES